MNQVLFNHITCCLFTLIIKMSLIFVVKRTTNLNGNHREVAYSHRCKLCIFFHRNIGLKHSYWHTRPFLGNLCPEHRQLRHFPLIKQNRGLLYLEGTVLENMDSIKYLGVAITHDLRWNTHISNMCTKANTGKAGINCSRQR